jgi:hypothetical protein
MNLQLSFQEYAEPRSSHATMLFDETTTSSFDYDSKALAPARARPHILHESPLSTRPIYKGIEAKGNTRSYVRGL